jgi:hypothetical protein
VTATSLQNDIRAMSLDVNVTLWPSTLPSSMVVTPGTDVILLKIFLPFFLAKMAFLMQNKA